MTDIVEKMTRIAMRVLSENCNAHPTCKGCQFNISDDNDWSCILREVLPGNWPEAVTWEEEHLCKSISEE